MGYSVFKKLAQKLASERHGVVSNPIEKSTLNKLTRDTINMYERKSDIKKFTKLVLSDPENDSHTDMVDELFKQGIVDPDADEKLMELSDNKRFLRDLGLID